MTISPSSSWRVPASVLLLAVCLVSLCTSAHCESRHPDFVVKQLLNVSVTWTPCTTYTNISGVWPPPTLPPTNASAFCTNLTFPLNWMNTTQMNSSQTINYFVKKVNATQQPSKGQVWLLQGGPGGSGVAMELLIPGLVDLMPQYDIMIPDHRGTGRSSPILCSQIANLTTPENVIACVKEVNETYGSEELYQYTTTNAAADIAGTMYATSGVSGEERERSKDEFDIFLYGVSYGSYWAQRYLVLAPNQATRVTIDGVCPPDLCRLADSYDPNQNVVGEEFMTACGEDSKICRQMLGDYPMEQMAVMFEEGKGGIQQCMAKLGLTTAQLRNGFAALLLSNSSRVLIGPLVKRLVYCSDEDVKEIEQLIFWQTGNGTVVNPGNAILLDNPLLGFNIGLSEIYSLQQPPPSAEYLNDLDETLYFSGDVAIEYSGVYPLWDKYDPHQSYGFDQFPNVTDQLLVMNGELDPQTIHAWYLHAIEVYGAAESQNHFVSIPYAPHGSAFFSANTLSNWPCGLQVMTSYFLNGKPDTACVNKLIPVDYDGTTEGSIELSLAAFGTSSLWGDIPEW